MIQLSLSEKRGDAALLVEIERKVGWGRLWDRCRDYGTKVTAGLLSFIRIVTYPEQWQLLPIVLY